MDHLRLVLKARLAVTNIWAGEGDPEVTLAHDALNIREPERVALAWHNAP